MKRAQSVDDIAAMHGFPALPLLLQQMGHKLLLHTVLGLDAEDVTYPYPRDTHAKLGQDNHGHEAHGPVDGAGLDAGGDVDGVVDGPHGGKAHHHAEKSQGGVDDSL